MTDNGSNVWTRNAADWREQSLRLAHRPAWQHPKHYPFSHTLATNARSQYQLIGWRLSWLDELGDPECYLVSLAL